MGAVLPASDATPEVPGPQTDGTDDSQRAEPVSTAGSDLDSTTAKPSKHSPLSPESVEPIAPSETLAPSQNALHSLILKVEERILDAFERKVAFDAFKEKQIDRLHEELQGYKAELLAKATATLFSSLIKLHGDVVRLSAEIAREDPAELTGERILKLFGSFREEIEDLLLGQGIQTFRQDADDLFDARRQSVAGTVETTDAACVGRVAERIRSGFERGNVLLDKEKVKVFVAAKQRSKPDIGAGEGTP